MQRIWNWNKEGTEVEELSEIAKARRGEPVSGIWRHRKKNGDVILVEISPRALLFGGRSAIMALMSDVTERIRARQALAEIGRAHV